MTTPRRGTGLFNLLLGFAEPTPTPAPPMPVDEPLIEAMARKRGLVTDTVLELDAKLFEIMYWPRNESPFMHTFANAKLKANGCKVFDFKICSDLGDSTGPTFTSTYMWYPESKGYIESKIMMDILTCAYHYRRYTLAEFATMFNEDVENDYLNLRFRYCQSCEKWLWRLGWDGTTQNQLYEELTWRCNNEGVRGY